jgi:hypothetical protein
LFSLGKVLYEMSTGKDRQEFPELPTNLRELPERDGLVELNAVIARACRHDPADRYANANEMRADLELLQSGKSLARLHRVEQRLRTVRRVGALITTLAFVAAVAFWFQATQTQKARKLAAENRKNADENLALADRNRAQLVQLNKADGFRRMEDGEIGSAMLSFAEALKYASNNSAQAEADRRRLSMLLQMHPKPVARIRIFDTNNNTVFYYCYLSDDGERLLLDSTVQCELWDLTGTTHRLASWPGATNRPLGRIISDGRAVYFAYTNKPSVEIWSV